MKQLKVIVDSTLASTNMGAYVTANFVTPVTVKKGSSICLDKFNATTKNIVENFSTTAQSFEFRSVPNNPNVLINIPAGKYDTVQDYLNEIEHQINLFGLSAFRSASQYEFSDNNFWNSLSQIGFGLSLTKGEIHAEFTIHAYGLSQISTTPSSFWKPSSDTVKLDTLGRFYSSVRAPYGIVSSNCMIGGGMFCGAQVTLLEEELAYPWSFGFENTTNLLLTSGRIGQKGGSGNLWLFGDNRSEFEIANSAELFPEAYDVDNNCAFCIYQKNGYFSVAYYPNRSDHTLDWTTVNVDLGSYSYPDQYIVQFSDEVGGANIIADMAFTPETDGDVNAVGNQMYHPGTQTSINFSRSKTLANVLGFADQYYTFTPYTAWTSTLVGLFPVDINVLRSAFELAIEITDLPLATYFARTGNNAGSGGRQNVICYFTPSIEITGLISFANSVHQWLEIDNKADTTLHSLSFRVFNPYSNDSFISNSMGFNLLIKSPDELEQ